MIIHDAGEGRGWCIGCSLQTRWRVARDGQFIRWHCCNCNRLVDQVPYNDDETEQLQHAAGKE